MATAVSVKTSTDGKVGALSCSICKKTFEEMTISSCFHTFCPDCLEGHIRSTNKTRKGYDHYTCPICGVEIELPGDYKMSRPLSKKSILAGDYPIYCTVCGPGKQAINSCLQCNEHFCQNCTSAHLKMKVSRYHSHRVQPIHPNSETSNVTTVCPRHPNQEIVVVCKKCNRFLCQLCKMLEHEGHVTRLVADEAHDVREELSQLLQNQIGMAENLQILMLQVQNRKEQYPKELEHEIHKVRQQSSILHLEIAREATAKEKELTDYYEFAENTGNESWHDMQKQYDSYTEMTKQAQNIIYGDDDLTAALRGRPLQQELSQFDTTRQPDDKKLHLASANKSFISGPIEKHQLKKMMGRVEGGSSHIQHAQPTERSPHQFDEAPSRQLSARTPDRPLSVQSVKAFNLRFTDGVGYIYGIAPIGDGKAWVTILDHQHVTLIDTHGVVVNSVDVGENCDSVTHDGNGGCYVTCQKSRSIKHVKVDGEIETVVEGLEQVPYGIAFMPVERSEGELFVCLMEPISRLTAFNDQRGTVRTFTESGVDISRKFLVQAPVRIGVDSVNGRVCVSDHTHGCMLVCEKVGGTISSLYTGEEGNDGLFKPLGICFDNTGNVIVTDWNNSRVERVTCDGDHLQTIADDVAGPQAVAVDADDNLWLGCRNGRIEIIKLW